MASSLKFGTSGLRGLATDLVGPESRRYAAAFISHLAASGQLGTELIVGRDLRESSPAIGDSVIAAGLDAGLTVLDLGEVSTPALALASAARRVPAIMVTGSHIPADRNGLKFYTAAGEIEKADETGILAGLDHPVTRAGGRRLAVADAMNAYRLRYRSLLAADGLAGWRVGVYQHSSVSRDLLGDILRDFGATVVPLGRSDIFVPVDTEAVSAETARMLSAWVAEHRLDAIVSADGDADRPLLVDNTGAVVRGDVLGILTAHFLGADAVVTPVTSNSAIEHTGYFAKAIRTKVGSPFVIAGMAEASAAGSKTVVGFEANGGVLLGSNAVVNGAPISALPTRDALLPLLAVLAAAVKSGKTLARLVATLPPRFASSDRLEHVPGERSALLLARLKQDAAAFLAEQGSIAAVSDIDGLRYELTSGDVIHYRPSGNAPELRCYTEASTPERSAALLAWGLAAAEKVVR